MNAVDVVQEIVEITVMSRDAKRVWRIRKKGIARTKATMNRLSETWASRREIGTRSGRQHEVL